MKCLICDSEYPDDWFICPKDGNDMRSPTPTVERPEREPDDMIAPAYGLPPWTTPGNPPPPREAKRTSEEIATLKQKLGREGRGPKSLAPAYGMPPMLDPDASPPSEDPLDERLLPDLDHTAAVATPELMVSAYGMAPVPPAALRPPSVPAMMPAYGIPPMTGKPRPLLALAIVVGVMIAAIIAVVLTR